MPSETQERQHPLHELKTALDEAVQAAADLMKRQPASDEAASQGCLIADAISHIAQARASVARISS